jgi:hypothetical protein
MGLGHLNTLPERAEKSLLKSLQELLTQNMRDVWSLLAGY